MSNRIEYNLRNGTAEQEVESLSLSDFEGPLQAVAESLLKKQKDLEEYCVNKPAKMSDYYADGYMQKLVQFKSLAIKEIGYNEPRLEIWGVREILPEERVHLEAQEAKVQSERIERDRKEFERLKEKFCS